MKSIRWLALVLVLAPVGAWRAMADDAPGRPAVERTEAAWVAIWSDAEEHASTLADERLWAQRAACARTDAWANYALGEMRRSAEARRAHRWTWRSDLLDAAVNSRRVQFELFDVDLNVEQLLAASTQAAAEKVLARSGTGSPDALHNLLRSIAEDEQKAKAAFLAGK